MTTYEYIMTLINKSKMIKFIARYPNIKTYIPIDDRLINLLSCLFETFLNESYSTGKNEFYSLFLRKDEATINILKEYFLKTSILSSEYKERLKNLPLNYFLLIIFNEFTESKKPFLMKSEKDLIESMEIFNDIKDELDLGYSFSAQSFILQEFENSSLKYQQDFNKAFNSWKNNIIKYNFK